MVMQDYNGHPQEDVSAGIFERAVEVMPSGCTRDLAAAKPYPHYIQAGSGAWVKDVDGNKIIDFVNNFASQIHGHAHPVVVEAISRQAAQTTCAILPSPWEVQLAEVIVDRIPSVDQVRFMNSGTEAILIATKLVRAYTGKTRIAKMEGGYHGQFDLMEASFQPTPENWGAEGAPNTTPNNPGTPQSLLDEVLVLPLNNIPATRALLRKHADELAAVFIDPLCLQLGLIRPEPDFLEMLREETAKLGIVLVFDEVLSLRADFNGTQGLRGITPDLTTMGKIIGGGLPVGAVGGCRQIMKTFDQDAVLRVKHSGTFTANPMTMAAGYASMKLLSPQTFDHLNMLAERLRDGLTKIRDDLKVEAVIYGEASLAAFLMTPEMPTNYRQMFAAASKGLLTRITALQQYLMKEGVLTMRGGFVCSTPMTVSDIDFALEGVRKALVKMKDA